MNEIAAYFHDGRTPVALPARLTLEEDSLRLLTPAGEERLPRGALTISPRVAQAARFIELPDGRQLCCPDSPLLDRFAQSEPSERLVAWLERRPWVSLASLVLTLVFVVTLHRHLLPAGAAFVAARIPVEYEHRLGTQALEALDVYLFEPSSLPVATQEKVREGLGTLLAGTPLREHPRLEFRDADDMPNAFALPGGLIVITDAVVEHCSLEQVLAILAHEVGHEEGRHALRQLLVSAGTGALVAAVVGDASSLTLLVSTAPVALLELEYSRELESEADERAFELLRKGRIRPGTFADALLCLQRHTPGKHAEDDAPSYLSSHPATAERIQRARARAY